MLQAVSREALPGRVWVRLIKRHHQNQVQSNFDLAVIRALQTKNGATVAALSAHYRRIWVRDVSNIAFCLLLADEVDLALELLQGLLIIHHDYLPMKVRYLVREGRPDADHLYRCMHPVFDEFGFEIPEQWGWLQNDATGGFLQCLALAEYKRPGFLTARDHKLIRMIIRYLGIIKCWGRDFSTWEDFYRVNATSVASCLVGTSLWHTSTGLGAYTVEECQKVLNELEGRHSAEEPVNLAHLQVYFPLMMTRDPYILERIEKELLGGRPFGPIRYKGDRFRGDHFANCEVPEAMWPFGLFWLGLAWLVCGNTQKAQMYLDWGNSCRLPSGAVPEMITPWKEKAHYRPTYYLGPNNPLAWGHAFALALHYLLAKTNFQPIIPQLILARAA